MAMDSSDARDGTGAADDIDLDDVDFLDLGASQGSSLEFATRRLGGRRGLGIDSDPRKVAQVRAKGLACLEGDATQLDLPDGCVRFVLMSHFLEHLPDLGAVRRTLGSAARVATDFLFIRGPYFDADGYLASLGLKFFWSHWSGHKTHLTLYDLHLLLRDLGLVDHVLLAADRLTDSAHPAIHPLASPINQHEYDPEVHPPKPRIAFHVPVYYEMVCGVRLRPCADWPRILRARKGAEPFPLLSGVARALD